MVCRADMRQYVGPPTVAAIAQMLRGGVEVNIKKVLATEIVTLEGHPLALCRSCLQRV